MFICSRLTSNTQFEPTENSFLETNGIYNNFHTLQFLEKWEIRNYKISRAILEKEFSRRNTSSKLKVSPVSMRIVILRDGTLNMRIVQFFMLYRTTKRKI